MVLINFPSAPILRTDHREGRADPATRMHMRYFSIFHTPSENPSFESLK
jgi:hypothetical protein